MTITIIIAAHNEEHRITDALHSLAEQTRPADTVIVICDRCTDGTAELAESYGARVLHTVGNTHRKAGALNQALMTVLPSLADTDSVLMMDADTALAQDFLAIAEERVTCGTFAVGAIFLAEATDTFGVTALQRNEYLRYAHDLHRRHARAEVISGTAGLFPVHALREIVDGRRGGKLPGEGCWPAGRGCSGYVYSLRALTEDNELTMAAKYLGYKAASPDGCTVVTEVMPTLKTLFYQRLRWQRGALSTLRDYGLTRTTLPYFIRQVLMYLGIMFFPFFVTVIVHAVIETGRFPWSWPWFFASLLLIVERVWTVRAGGLRALILAILVLPEIVYDMFQHYVLLRAGVDELVRSDEHWDHAEAQDGGREKRWWPWLFIPAATMLACLAAVLCIWLEVQWIVIGVIVASGIAHACLRATPLDPLVLVYGSYQLACRGCQHGGWEGD